jgi:hypothetical protein
MNFGHPIRIKTSVILLVFLALLSNIQLLTQTLTSAPGLIGKDEISLYEKRFEGLKKILPAHGVVGYITGEGLEPIRANTDYHLTQYTLAPVIVLRTYQRRLVVGNFTQGASGREVAAKHNLTVLKDFGNGVMLLSNEAK